PRVDPAVRPVTGQGEVPVAAAVWSQPVLVSARQGLYIQIGRIGVGRPVLGVETIWAGDVAVRAQQVPPKILGDRVGGAGPEMPAVLLEETDRLVPGVGAGIGAACGVHRQCAAEVADGPWRSYLTPLLEFGQVGHGCPGVEGLGEGARRGARVWPAKGAFVGLEPDLEGMGRHGADRAEHLPPCGSLG